MELEERRARTECDAAEGNEELVSVSCLVVDESNRIESNRVISYRQISMLLLSLVCLVALIAPIAPCGVLYYCRQSQLGRAVSGFIFVLVYACSVHA